jgi:Cof subfamily protein (haloacid dehalogenase superfamily)
MIPAIFITAERKRLLSYKLLALDLDGTLLDKDHQLSPKVTHVVKEIIDRGFKVTLATNRMFESANNFAKALNIDFPLITYGGALVKSPATGEILLDLRITKEAAAKALDLMKNEVSSQFLFQSNEVYTNQRSIYTERYETILGIKLNIVPVLKEVLEENPTYLVFYVKIEDVERLTRRLREHLGSIAQLTNSAPYFIDVIHPEATKGRGLKKIAEFLHLKRDEIIAVGDGLNDMEMIEYAGMGIAVANASPELKKKADHITQAEREEGVIEAIRKFIFPKP